MKQASADGLRNKTKKPDKEGITEEEENTFWEKNLLGSQTAKSLLHTIYFYNGKLFGIRSNEHRNLRYINLRVESNCIIYDESVSKTYHGGLKDLKYKPRVVKHVCCKENCELGHSRCLVECYKKYLEHIKTLSEEIDAFYFKPSLDETVFSYHRSPVGINTLNKILPDKLCGAAGLKKKTSHSLRVTCATRLFQNCVQETLIRERTGHRSDALIRYEKKSEEQEKSVSSILGPPACLDKQKCPDLGVDLSSELPLVDFDFDVSGDILLSNLEMPANETSSNVTNNLSNCVFNNCTFALGK